MDRRAARRALRNYREYLTRQELRTLNGQICAGYADDAMRGLARLLAEWKEKQTARGSAAAERFGTEARDG